VRETNGEEVYVCVLVCVCVYVCYRWRGGVYVCVYVCMSVCVCVYVRTTHDANAAFGTSVLCTLSGAHSALSAQ
jgi:hypothetical protein